MDFWHFGAPMRVHIAPMTSLVPQTLWGFLSSEMRVMSGSLYSKH